MRPIFGTRNVIRVGHTAGATSWGLPPHLHIFEGRQVATEGEDWASTALALTVHARKVLPEH
eukprot:11429604-Alexandrium_andersonii.AAC.1